MKRCLDPAAIVGSLCLLFVLACGGGAKDTKDTKASATAASTKTDDGGKAADDGGKAVVDDGGKAVVDDGGKAAVDDGKAGVDESGDGKAADEGKAVDDGKAADDGKADTGGAAAPADPKALLGEVTTKKTTDERSLAALTEAEAAGAKPRELAKAAFARGNKLFEAPDRAKAFFEWAAAKDPKYPDPLFALAKQAVVTGEIDQAKELLKQVHARGGKKLLSQIDFDQTWEIVKDDPEIRKLLP